MIFTTNMIAFTVFPSIIVYKPLPGDYFNTDSDTKVQVALMGAINIGSFLIAYSIGCVLTAEYLTPD